MVSVSSFPHSQLPAQVAETPAGCLFHAVSQAYAGAQGLLSLPGGPSAADLTKRGERCRGLSRKQQVARVPLSRSAAQCLVELGVLGGLLASAGVLKETREEAERKAVPIPAGEALEELVGAARRRLHSVELYLTGWREDLVGQYEDALAEAA